MGFREEIVVMPRREEPSTERFNLEAETLKPLKIPTYRLGIFREGEDPVFKIFTTNAEYALPIIFSEALSHIDYLERKDPNIHYYLKAMD